MAVITITPEIALEELSTYAGGLGVLEGDKFLAAAKKGLKYYVLTLLYRHGYVEYSFDNETPTPKPQTHPIPPYKLLEPEEELSIQLKGENAIIRPWVFSLGNAKAVFFEGVCPYWVRNLTNRVYIENNEDEKHYKYVLLAKAAAKYLQERIGLENISILDLQEAYTVLTMLALENNVSFRFIVHTPGPWGHPHFPARILHEEFGLNEKVGSVTLTEIGLKKALKVITVSKKHREITIETFNEYKHKISAITNGISIDRWMHPLIKRLIGEKGVNNLTPDELWRTHQRVREELLRLLSTFKPGIAEKKNWPIILWARRLSQYKRPYFMKRLLEEEGGNIKAVIVLGGKAHPADDKGLTYMRDFMKLHKSFDNVVYIPNYDLSVAKVMLSGSDIHLFTPFPGWEACGTSYMKTSINGVPSLASRDGGALEIFKDGENSWFFGHEAKSFIDIYRDPEARKIDEEDYQDFKEKLQIIIKLWNSKEFREVSLNALKTTLPKVDIERILDKYYPPK